MLKIYNTAAREKQDFVPIEPGRVRMYVCGMTVYDFCEGCDGRVSWITQRVRACNGQIGWISTLACG